MMSLKEVYVALGTLLLVTSDQNCEASVVQAALDLGGEDEGEFFKMMFKKLDLLANRHQNNTNHTQLQGHTELASALLEVAPVIVIKGNITDPSHRFTVTFTVHASHNNGNAGSSSGAALNNREDDDDDVDEDEDGDDHCWECGGAWRGSGGVFYPLVSTVEPYLLSLVELVFQGILSAVIGNFLQATAMMQDVRLV